MVLNDLETVNKNVRVCTLCRLHKTRKNAVPGEGNSKTNLFMLGQAPGKEEDEKGALFLGPSGEKLNQLLSDLKLSRVEFYMTNLVKCILPKARKPRSDEINACNVYLKREIELVNPKVIITLGYHPTKAMLKEKDLPVPNRNGFPELFGKIISAGNRLLLPLRHPANLVHGSAKYSLLLNNYRKIHVVKTTCKWYQVCPIKTYFDMGKLSGKWIHQYCKGDWQSCIRYQLEENYMPHPDNMLPNGEIDHNL